MNTLQTRPTFFSGIICYKDGVEVDSYTVGDVITVKAYGVNSAYKSAFQGISFLEYDGTTELSYTATSEGWNSEDDSEYDMTFTVPDTFSYLVFVTTKFDTTGMYDIAVNATYPAGTTNYSTAEINENYIYKALPGTTVELYFSANLTNSESEVSFDNWTGLSGISTSDFGTWNIENEDGDFYGTISFTMPSNNVAMTANFAVSGGTVTHTVTFKSGATTVDTVTVEDGTAIPSAEIPEAPSVTGKEFDYWALDGEEFDFDTLITDDIELDAVYKDAEYTVTFKEGEETVKEVKVGYEEKVSYIDPTTMTDSNGKEFMFWVDSNNKEFDFNTPITEDTTLTAYYAQAGSAKWLMSLPNCFVGLKSDVAELPIARVADGTKALALSANAGEEAAYMFNKATLTWIELQHYSVRI